MAYEIVKRLKRFNPQVLITLENAVTKKEKKDGKLHRVFNPSFDTKICRDRRFVEQKLDYIHFNPVKGKWNLVEDYVDYDHSSARYYELGQESEVPITHYMDLI